jgi:hypothetical protein
MLLSLAVVLGFGMLVGLVFVAGCWLGAWIQRDIGFVIRQKETVERAQKRAKAVPMDQPPKKGVEHPSGAPMPTPQAVRRKDPMDWTNDLQTGSGLAEVVRRSR